MHRALSMRGLGWPMARAVEREERARNYQEEMKRVAGTAGSRMCGLNALTGISTRFP